MKWFKKKLRTPKRREPALNGGLTERLSDRRRSPDSGTTAENGPEPLSIEAPKAKPKRWLPSFALPKRLRQQGSRSPKKSTPKTSAATDDRAVLIGIPFGGADFWLRLRPDGNGERLTGLPDAEVATPAFDNARVFRMAMYDKALLFPKKLTGKALRNAMIREKEISDIPVSFTAHQLRWFTRKSSVELHERPVHPLAASLWSYARKQGWNPTEGVLLRMALPMQESTLWMYVALGKTGIGLPQTAIIPKESDRPAYNMALSAGILPKEFPTHDIPADQLYAWLAQGKPLRYPQPSEWFGLPMAKVGHGVMVSGILLGLMGTGIWWFGQSHLAQAQRTQHTLRRSEMRLAQMRQVYLRHHIFLIAKGFNIRLPRDLTAARALWKPGTRVVMADGLSLKVGMGMHGPAIARPGASGPMQQHPAQVAVLIPETKNHGPGQPGWMSPSIMASVIQQPPFDGFTLHVIHTNTGGNGYVVIFSRTR